jgi:hypothetical protein
MEHRIIDGEIQTGWMFSAEWPLGLESAEHVGGVK